MDTRDIKDDGGLQRSWLGTDARVVRHVHVFGSGQLAMATRLELARLGIHRDSDYHLRSLLPPLVIACGDFDGDSSFKDPARQLLDERPPMLFACLGPRTVRIGPLVEPRSTCIARPPGRADTYPIGSSSPYPQGIPDRSGGAQGVRESDPNQGFLARVGAVLIAGQALNFLLGARNQCVLGRVVEFDPFAIESKTYRVLKVTQ